MDVHKIQLKLFFTPTNGVRVSNDTFVRVFHRFIQDRVLPELMLDVATYEHVKDGPSVLFVGHGSDYYIDEGKGRTGLLYSRKREAPAPDARLGDAFRRALHVATLLERDPLIEGRVRFKTDEGLIRINDRLEAPNTPETFARLSPEIARALAGIHGA